MASRTLSQRVIRWRETCEALHYTVVLPMQRCRWTRWESLDVTTFLSFKRSNSHAFAPRAYTAASFGIHYISCSRNMCEILFSPGKRTRVISLRTVVIVCWHRPATYRNPVGTVSHKTSCFTAQVGNNYWRGTGPTPFVLFRRSTGYQMPNWLNTGVMAMGQDSNNRTVPILYWKLYYKKAIFFYIFKTFINRIFYFIIHLKDGVTITRFCEDKFFYWITDVIPERIPRDL